MVTDRSSVSSSEVAAALGVTRQTAHRNLAALVERVIWCGGGGVGDSLLSVALGGPAGYRGLVGRRGLVGDQLEDVGDSLRTRLGSDDPLAPLAWASITCCSILPTSAMIHPDRWAHCSRWVPVSIHRR